MAEEDNAPVRITLARVYEKVENQDAKLDSHTQLLARIADRLDSVVAVKDDHETRIREAEKDRASIRYELQREVGAVREDHRVFKGRATLVGSLALVVLTPTVSAAVAFFLR